MLWPRAGPCLPALIGGGTLSREDQGHWGGASVAGLGDHVCPVSGHTSCPHSQQQAPPWSPSGRHPRAASLPLAQGSPARSLQSLSRSRSWRNSGALETSAGLGGSLKGSNWGRPAEEPTCPLPTRPGSRTNPDSGFPAGPSHVGGEVWSLRWERGLRSGRSVPASFLQQLDCPSPGFPEAEASVLTYGVPGGRWRADAAAWPCPLGGRRRGAPGAHGGGSWSTEARVSSPPAPS